LISVRMNYVIIFLPQKFKRSNFMDIMKVLIDLLGDQYGVKIIEEGEQI